MSGHTTPSSPDIDQRRKDLLEMAKKTPPFSGIPTFFRAPYCSPADPLEIALMGIPYDGGLSDRTGAREGPRSIRAASLLPFGYNHQTRILPLEICLIGDIGDVQINDWLNHDNAIEDIYQWYRANIRGGVLPITAGGDHSVTYPILKALASEEPLALVHFDSHCDTTPEGLMSKFSHASPFLNAAEAGIIDPKKTIQIGIRGTSELLWDYSYQSGMRVIHVEEFYEIGWKQVIHEIKRIIGDSPVYITVDIDVLDPAYAPGTGTPEVGGITTFELQQVLRGLTGVNFIGGDVVEVSPPYDPAGITALAGAAIMFELLCIGAYSVNVKRAAP